MAISSYSDAGAEGSLLAHGAIDNVIIQVPEPPVVGLVGQMYQGQWQVDFTGRSHWTYVMQSTSDFKTWADAALDVSSQTGRVVLRDGSAPAAKAFYRVRAERP